MRTSFVQKIQSLESLDSKSLKDTSFQNSSLLLNWERVQKENTQFFHIKFYTIDIHYILI
jgi:hypothetical protein